MSSYHGSYSTASSSIGKHRNSEFPTNSLADVTSGLAFNQEYSLKFIYVVQGIPICLLGIPFNISFKNNQINQTVKPGFNFNCTKSYPLFRDEFDRELSFPFYTPFSILLTDSIEVSFSE